MGKFAGDCPAALTLKISGGIIKADTKSAADRRSALVFQQKLTAKFARPRRSFLLFVYIFAKCVAKSCNIIFTAEIVPTKTRSRLSMSLTDAKFVHR